MTGCPTVDVFSCAYLPSIYLWWNVCSPLLCVFKLGYLFILLSSWEFYIYSGYRSFIRWMICRYFFLLAFRSLKSVYWRVGTLNFNCLVYTFRKSVKNPRSQRFSPLWNNRSITVLGVIFRSDPLWVTFCIWGPAHVGIQHFLLKRYIFPIELPQNLKFFMSLILCKVEIL